MAYRFKARSTTPGQYRLAPTTLSQLVSVADVRLGVNRGDGGIGTFAGGDYATGYATGLAFQLATDVAAVTAAVAGITTTTTILGVTGTLNMSLYELVTTGTGTVTVPSSLKEMIGLDVTSVFLNIGDFAETVTFYPSGDHLQQQSVLAVVIWDELEGTRESYGDGVTLERDHGTAIRQSVKLEMAASVSVDDARRPPDIFKLADGTLVVVKRILGKDDGMQTVLCTRRDNISMRKPVKSG